MRVLYRTCDRKLFVLSDALKSESFIADLSRALLTCWKLEPFTESRWLTLGNAGRSYTRAHLLGFASVVGHAKERKSVSAYQVG
eukprot:4750446-Amphidinium_carterae.1